MKSRRTILRRLFYPRWLYLVLKRKQPISPNYGSSRGEPIDRYYIEQFLSENQALIKGVTLEVEDATYATQFGGEQVIRKDIIDIDPQNQRATIIADLRHLRDIPDNVYDCTILTQVLQFIDDYPAAIRECYRILKPGGTLLATVPSLSRADCRTGPTGDFWRFATAGAHHAVSQVFAKDKVTVKPWGNLVSGLGFWVGLAQEDLSKTDLNYNDPAFPCLISIVATK